MEDIPSTNEGWEELNESGAVDELYNTVISVLEKEDYDYNLAEVRAAFYNAETGEPYLYDEVLEAASSYLTEKGLDFDELFGADADIIIEFEEYEQGQPLLDDFQEEV